jgi:hypothetical protein
MFSVVMLNNGLVHSARQATKRWFVCEGCTAVQSKPAATTSAGALATNVAAQSNVGFRGKAAVRRTPSICRF